MKIKVVFISLVLVCMSFVSEDSSSVIGVWWTPKKDAKIKIFLATDGKYYGKIIWLLEPNDANNKPKVDIHNDNASLRTRPIMNMLILTALSYDSKEKAWNSGKVYDAEHGDTYDCVLTLKDATHLNVRGYIKAPMFGQTMVFTKVDTD
jgi:uncharacterized protein (DUF2147 family)